MHLEEYRDILNRLGIYLDLLKSSGFIVNRDILHRLSDITEEVKKIQIEIS